MSDSKWPKVERERERMCVCVCVCKRREREMAMKRKVGFQDNYGSFHTTKYFTAFVKVFEIAKRLESSIHTSK